MPLWSCLNDLEPFYSIGLVGLAGNELCLPFIHIISHAYMSSIFWSNVFIKAFIVVPNHLLLLLLSISRQYEVQCPPAQEVREIVNMHLAEKEVLDNSLPGCIVIGPFHLSVEGVRQNLSKKCKALATSMLDILAKNLHNQVEDVS